MTLYYRTIDAPFNALEERTAAKLSLKPHVSTRGRAVASEESVLCGTLSLTSIQHTGGENGSFMHGSRTTLKHSIIETACDGAPAGRGEIMIKIWNYCLILWRVV
jgi:hypothetical protein